jgi:hypothetical protein
MLTTNTNSDPPRRWAARRNRPPTIVSLHCEELHIMSVLYCDIETYSGLNLRTAAVRLREGSIV